MRQPDISEGFIKNKRLLIFLGFVALVCIHHALVFLGFYEMDDLNYVKYAAKVASGESLNMFTHDHFELRWTAIYATAFFYKIFGINDFSSAAFGLSSTILTGYLLFRMLYKAPVNIAIIAFAFFFLNYNTLYSSHRLWPDSAITLCFLGAFNLYLKAAEEKNKWHSIGFAALIFIALLTKETVVLFLPLLGVLFLRDITTKRLLGFWKEAILILAVLFFGYLLLFKIVTGDWLYRYTVLKTSSYESICSFDLLPFIETLKRIGYYLWEAFLLNGDLSVFIFGLSGFIYRNKIMPGRRERDLALAFFVLLMSANFMTFSYKNYVPLCHDPRHFLFLIPFAAFSGSYALNAYFLNPGKYWLMLLFSSIATIIIFASNGGETKYIYLLINIVLLAAFIPWPGWMVSFKLSALLFLTALCFMIKPVNDIFSKRFYYYNDHKKIISTDFPKRFPDALVLTGDYRTSELSEYLLKFNTGGVVFSHLQYAPTLLQNHHAGDVYILINEASQQDLANEALRLSEANPGGLKLIIKEGAMALYELKSLELLDALTKKAIL